jgi:hypothetical protein
MPAYIEVMNWRPRAAILAGQGVRRAGDESAWPADRPGVHAALAIALPARRCWLFVLSGERNARSSALWTKSAQKRQE